MFSLLVTEYLDDDNGASEYTIVNNTSDTLDAAIETISRFGIVKVAFSQMIVVPEGYEEFDNHILSLTL